MGGRGIDTGLADSLPSYITPRKATNNRLQRIQQTAWMRAPAESWSAGSMDDAGLADSLPAEMTPRKAADFRKRLRRMREHEGFEHHTCTRTDWLSATSRALRGAAEALRDGSGGGLGDTLGDPRCPGLHGGSCPSHSPCAVDTRHPHWGGALYTNPDPLYSPYFSHCAACLHALRVQESMCAAGIF